MGNSLSSDHIQYAVPVADPPFHAGEKWDSPWDIFQFRMRQPGTRNLPYLGSRSWNVATQETSEQISNQVHWVTYSQVEELTIAFAKGLIAMALVSTVEFPNEMYEPARRMAPLGIVSKNRPEWFVIEQATSATNCVLVPLYESLGDEALMHVLNQTQMGAMAVSKESGWAILQLLKRAETDERLLKYTSCLTTMILMDRVDGPFNELADSMNIRVVFWKDVVLEGRKRDNIELEIQQKHHVCTLAYTSGTTGAPKGVMITAGNYAACVAAEQRCIMAHPGFRINHSDTHISYLPLAHVFERLICANCTCLGVKIAFYSGDTQKLLDDMKVIKPTIFLSVPRLYMRINDKVFSGIQDKSAVAQYLFKAAVETKLANLREKGVYHHPLWDSLIFNKIRKLMGGNVKFMLVGGAPLEAIVQERISILFCSPLMHGFGMTEMGAVFICNPGERVAGHIGGVQPCIEFTLRSIPEMNYVVTEEEACGELLVRGPSVTPGYLMNPEATADSIDEQGWLHTGDIAILLPGNSVKIIDRKKNIFKLAQGEYVAPERIEAIYTRGLLVAQIFVHGDSSKINVVAVVVPDEEMVGKWTQQNERPFSSLAEICQDSDFKTAVMSSMEEAAKEAGLKGFEKVKDIHLEPEPFTVDNDLLTPTLKLRRHIAKKRYAPVIEQMYRGLGQ